VDIKDAIYHRRAERAYTSEGVDETVLRELIDAAVQAPSAMNAQSWTFCIVRDPTMLADIATRAREHMLANTPAGLLSHHVDTVLHEANFDIFYGAPALVLICSTTDHPWAVENCALAAENLMLAAHAAGLGTCWIGFAQAWLRSAEGKAFLNIPSEIRPVAPIIVGHPAGTASVVPRKPAEIRWFGANRSLRSA
jgi:nitroreductase